MRKPELVSQGGSRGGGQLSEVDCQQRGVQKSKTMSESELDGVRRNADHKHAGQPIRKPDLHQAYSLYGNSPATGKH